MDSAAASVPPATAPGPATAPRRWVGATIALVIGSLLALTGLAVLVAGGAALWATAQSRGTGFFQTPTVNVAAQSFALVSPPMELTTDLNSTAAVPFDLVSLRLVAESADSATPIFIGVGPEAEVDRYLANVHHTVLTSASGGPMMSRYRDVPGRATPALPGEQDFWELSSVGAGEQKILWDLQTVTPSTSGSWTIVGMNADASENVAVQLTAGARTGLLAPIGWALVASGLVVLLIGVALIVVGAVSLGRRTPPGPSAPAPSGFGLGPPPPNRQVPARRPADLGSTRTSWPPRQIGRAHV